MQIRIFPTPHILHIQGGSREKEGMIYSPLFLAARGGGGSYSFFIRAQLLYFQKVSKKRTLQKKIVFLINTSLCTMFLNVLRKVA